MTMTSIPPDVVRELVDALGTGVVATDPDILGSHAADQARFCPAGTASVLVRPRSTSQVSIALQIAARHGVPVVPQGARTGLSGGANAVDGCVLLSLTRMGQILRIDVAEQIAVVQPGVVNADWPGQSPVTGCSTRRTRHLGKPPPSAATSPPTPAACAV